MSAIEVRTASSDEEAWIEYDGRWTTFNLQVGNDTQRQNFRIIPSISSYAAWLPAPNGACQVYQRPLDACVSSVGIGHYEGRQSSGFMGNRSTTFQDYPAGFVKIGTLDVGSLFGADYNEELFPGADVVRLEDVNSNNITNPDRSLIYSTPSELWPTAMLGLGFGETVLSGNPIRSFMDAMSGTGIIPSRSWGYTAGAWYGNDGTGARGSLVLGGYNAAHIRNETSATLKIQEGAQRLVVDVSGIRIAQPAGSSRESGETFKAIIDSTLPYLYLPNTTIDMFVEYYNLTEMPMSGLPSFFYMNASTLAAHRDITSGISFFINDGVDSTNPNTTTITFPYDAFPVQPHWTWPGDETVRLFPIRRMNSSAEYAVLGRAFMQEAYIHANFEPDIMKFNISQRAYPASGVPSDIVTVLATPPTIIDNRGSGMARGAVAGVVIGAVAAVAFVLFGIWWFIVRRRRAKAKAAALAAEKNGNKGDPFPMIDSEAGSDSRRATETGTWLSEIDGTQSSYPASLLRPGHGRHESYASELSSDSDHEHAHAKMLMATLHERHELEGNHADERMKLAGGSTEPSPRTSPTELPASTEWPLLDAQTNEAPKPDSQQRASDEPGEGTQTMASTIATPATPAAAQQPERSTPSKLESRFQEAVDTEPSKSP